jgi:tetratricopeptide (TPR) repeat protein
MPFCYQCGNKFTLGIEKFCPKCGYDLNNWQTDINTQSTHITDTTGDVIGTGFTGSGNFIGKEINYKVQGNVININISESTSKGVVDNLKEIISTPPKSESLLDKTAKTDEEFEIRIEKSIKTCKQIKSVLDEVNKIEKAIGKDIEKIKVGDMYIDKKELSLKGYILEGDSHVLRAHKAVYGSRVALLFVIAAGIGIKIYAEKEYKKGIKCYDQALEIDPNNLDSLLKKGSALQDLGKYDKAIECYDKSLKLNPDSYMALNNKGMILLGLKRFDESIEYFDKSLKIKPDFAVALDNKLIAQKKNKKVFPLDLERHRKVIYF